MKKEDSFFIFVDINKLFEATGSFQENRDKTSRIIIVDKT